MSKSISFRYHQWLKPKTGILLSLMFFTGTIYNPEFTDFIKIFVLSLIAIISIGSLGHFINDIGDVEYDSLSGKTNSIEKISFPFRWLMFFLLVTSIIIPWIFLPRNLFTHILLVSEFMLLIVYPLKPFRLKRFPLVAIPVDAFYAYAIPGILAIHTYNLSFGRIFPALHYLILFFWLSALGIRHILYHHVYDSENDRKSGINNIAHIFSVNKINVFIRKILLPAELIFGIAFMLLFIKVNFLLSVISIFLFIMYFNVFSSIFNISLFYKHSIGEYRYDKFYAYVWSVVSLFFLIKKNWFFSIFLIIVIFTLSNFGSSRLMELLLSVISNIIKFFSNVVNYSIYYFRKYILRYSEKKSRGPYYLAHLDNSEKRKNGKIAIVNSTYKKYTETFINAHYKLLPFTCEYYYGSTTPIQNVKSGNLISNNKLINKIKELNYLLFSVNTKSLFIGDIQKKNVSLILAEFGTSAVMVTDASFVTGIPLIAIFYGYDAWHTKTVSENKTDYEKLFHVAKVIIGVSQDICKRLIVLGCPEEKIIYLPCYVNLNLFKYYDHSNNPPVFISVGRFTETKSPHLTILAFHEVLKKIPNAKLIMIGKDGGGELFEACIILAKALQIEPYIEFKGIQSPEQVYEHMKSARVFVQHSLTTPINSDKEGTPVSILEAMACGLPVVSTIHAGIKEVIENNVSGILVEEYDYIEMAKQMVEVCSSDKLVYDLGLKASESINSNPLISNNIQKLTEIIKQHQLK